MENKKILIVEDDRDYLFILKTSFTGAGFSVMPALSAEEAMALTEKEKPDLALIDIKLPGMDGIEMAKKMKEAGEKFPMVFLTNLGDESSISKALEATASDYMVKSDMKIEDIVERVKSKLGV